MLTFKIVASTIPYKLILSVLETNGLSTQIDENYRVQPFQLTKIVYDIYFAAEKLGYFKNCLGFNLESAISVTISFFWKVFDPLKTNSIFLIEIKELFLILCKVNSMQSLLTELINLICNRNRYISIQKLRLLLATFIKVLVEIGEGSAYGPHNIKEILEQLYAMYPGVMGIDEFQFQYLWLNRNTRFAIYVNLLVLIQRMKDTENLIHETQCSECKIETIMGIRFACNKCKQLSLCMRCFAIGFTNKYHKNDHGMFEVFKNEPPNKKNNFLILKRLRSAFCFQTTEKNEEISEHPGIENHFNVGLEKEYTSLVRNAFNECDKNINKLDDPFIQKSHIVVGLQTLKNNVMDHNNKLEKHASQLHPNYRTEFLLSDLQFLEEIKNKINLLIVSLYCYSFNLNDLYFS